MSTSHFMSRCFIFYIALFEYVCQREVDVDIGKNQSDIRFMYFYVMNL